MATIKSSLVFQDKMTSAIQSVSNALESASVSSKLAKTNLDELEKAQKEWKTTLDAAQNSANKNTQNIEMARKKYEEASKAVDKATLQYLKYEGQVIKNTAKLEQLNKKQEEFNNSVDDSNNKLQQTIKGLSIFGVSIGTVIGNMATRAIENLKNSIGQAIESASDLAEVQNVVDVAFGNSSNAINQWSQTTLKQFGLNELTTKKFVGTIGAMLRSSGLAGDAVIEMATKITELSGDMASFYNLTSEEAFDKIRSGISGVTMPLKQLGIDMSVANLEAFALSKGMKVQYNNMSQAAQMVLRYQYLLEVTKDAQGDFMRTQDSFANQQKLATENWLRLSSMIANMFIPALTAGYKIMNNIMNFLADNLTTIVPILTATLGAATLGFTLMKLEAIQTGIASVTAAAQALGAWIAATAPLWIIIGVIGLVSVALNALGLSFKEQAENIVISFNWIITSLKNIWIAVQNTWTFITNLAKNYIDLNKLALASFFGWVLSKLEGVAKIMDKIFHTNIADSIQNLSSATEKAKEQLTYKIRGNLTSYKDFEANDIWTNQAKAQKFMSGASNLVASAGAGIQNMGIPSDLMTSTQGGKALKTKNQGEIQIAQEDIKLLHDIATRDYMVNYQQLTPQVTLQGLTINEMVDANQVVDMIVEGISEAADTKLQVVS